MKVKPGFMLSSVMGKDVAVSVGNERKCIIKLNDTSALIWKGIESGKTAEEVADILVQTYGIGKDRAMSDVLSFCSHMVEEGIFDAS